jgi:hypothetical protein
VLSDGIGVPSIDTGSARKSRRLATVATVMIAVYAGCCFGASSDQVSPPSSSRQIPIE